MRLCISKTTVAEKLESFLKHELDEKELSSWASKVLTDELKGELMPNDLDRTAVGWVLLQLEQLDEPEAKFSKEEAKYYIDSLERCRDEHAALLCVRFWPLRENMKVILQKRLSGKISDEHFERWKLSFAEQPLAESFHFNLSKLTEQQLMALGKHLVSERDPIKDLAILRQMNLLAVEGKTRSWRRPQS